VRKNEMVLKDTQPGLRVVKSNTLVNAKLKQRYTAQEIKTITWILANIPKDYTYTDEALVLSAADYANLLGVNTKSIYRDGVKIATALMSRALVIESPEKDEWIVCNWFSFMSYKKGKFYIKPHEIIIPHVLHLKSHFTQYQLSIILSLKSKYSIRLYELLCQYKSIGKRVFEYTELREKLGIAATELKQFTHFKSRVLDIAQKEICSKTDLSFDWTPIQKGRLYSHIEFKIKLRPASIIERNSKEEATSDLTEKLQSLGINKDVAYELIQEFGLEKVIEKWNYLQFKLDKGDRVGSPQGFLVDAIVKDYSTIEMEDSKKTRGLSGIDKAIHECNLEISGLQGSINGHLARYQPEFKKESEKKLEIKLAELDTLLEKKAKEKTVSKKSEQNV
jgi:plasmid replication initiation protein